MRDDVVYPPDSDRAYRPELHDEPDAYYRPEPHPNNHCPTPPHPPEFCDEDAYFRGYEDGYKAGYDEGFASGKTVGFAAGYEQAEHEMPLPVGRRADFRPDNFHGGRHD